MTDCCYDLFTKAFEFDLGDEVKEYYYVVGTDEGNFYNDENTFSVSKRLDEGIIKNLSFITSPLLII